MKKILAIFALTFVLCSDAYAQTLASAGITVKVFGEKMAPDSMAFIIDDSMNFVAKSLYENANISKKTKDLADRVISTPSNLKNLPIKQAVTEQLDLLIKLNQNVIQTYNIVIEMADMTMMEYSTNFAECKLSLDGLKKNNQRYIQLLNADIAWAKQKLVEIK